MSDKAGHHHDHGEAGFGGKLLLSMVITTLALVAEIVAGVLTGSLALLSDAAHVFLDIFALGLSYGATRMATLPPSAKHSYGFSRMKVLAAGLGANLLVASSSEGTITTISTRGPPFSMSWATRCPRSASSLPALSSCSPAGSGSMRRRVSS
ncbi:MAG TPA: cation transporter [Rectinemataceae bacterium]|nr:cation transporter [Rectinemataceae bacterium]